MMKSKKAKILTCIIFLLVLCGSGVIGYASYQNYQKEKALMVAGANSEIIEAFHDQGSIYMEPSAPGTEDEVTIRLRTVRYNVTKAQIQMTLDEGLNWTCIEMTYDKTDDTGYYDLWVGEIPAQNEPYFYRFALGNDYDSTTMYYGTEGLKSYQLDKAEMFYVIPGFDTPEWSKGALWYYAHTGQFYNGDTSNDLYKEYLMIDNTYGNDSKSMMRGSGDLAGVSEKLDYIQSLGVNVLALGPYFSSSETVGFGIDNMQEVENAFGTEELMKNLIDEIHERDMKITTDMIISYSSDYSKYYDRYHSFPTVGAYESQKSRYYSLFAFPQWPNNAVKVWGSIGLNIADEEAAKLIYKNPDSMLLNYLNEPYGLDGYRFDAEESVGNLGYEYDPETYFANIRASIKGVSEDKLMLSENCTGIADQYNTLFDSSWQKNGYFAMKAWFEGSSSGSEMLKTLQDNLINTARPRALSSYNFIGQHDVVRLWNDTEVQKNDIQSLLLLQMTYLGSPVIYFGDETGLTNGYYDDQKYSPFVWDESQWDYDVLNLVKALGQARKEYSCLRTGLVCQGEVDDAKLFLAFGRFDDDGAVITLCNKQGTVVEREINVSRYNVSDGDKLTDYLTGQVYTVKDGKVAVDIIPGGTLLVTGKVAGVYREQYTVKEIGKDVEVLQTDAADFTVTGKGNLSGTKDTLGLLETKVFNNVTMSAQVLPEKGEAVLMLRNTNEKESAFYAVKVKGDVLTVLARTSEGEKVKEITTLSIPEGVQIQLAREGGNQFVVSYREKTEDEWSRIDKSVCQVAMSESLYAGVTALSKTVTFNNVAVTAGVQQICDDFESYILGSMFTASSNDVNPTDGTLVLASEKDNMSYVKANAHSSDWTFKTQVAAVKPKDKTDTALAGVMSMFDEEDCVIVARAQIDGKEKLVFGKLMNGKLQLSGIITDTYPEKDVTVQLQRIGSRYSAVANYGNEKWFAVGESIYCNYTKMYAGVFTANAEAAFEYACFGDSINDKATVNTPITPGAIETGYDGMFHNITHDMMAFLGNEETWEDIGSGYEQTSEEGASLLYYKNKLFTDVKSEASIQIKSGDGTAGILIGKQKSTNDTKECYQIALDMNKKLAIRLNGKELNSCQLDSTSDMVRLVVRRENGYIHVFAGADARLVLSLQDTTYEEGFVSYYTDGVAAAFVNCDITALGGVWSTNSTVLGTENAIELISANTLVSLESVGLTEGVITFQATTTLADDTEGTNEIGVILGGSFGRRDGYGGVAVFYNYRTGILEAKECGDSLGKVSLAEPGEKKAISAMVIFRRGQYEIYVDGSKKPLLTVEAKKPNGGSLSIWSSSGTTYFYNTEVCDITGVADVEQLSVVKAFRAVKGSAEYNITMADATGTIYTDNFSDYTGWYKNVYKFKTDYSDWYIEDGVLKAVSRLKNWNIAYISSGLYENVDVSMKARFTDYEADTASAISINIGKQRAYTGREDSGVSFTVFGSGFVRAYDTAKKQNLNGWDTYISHPEEWFEMRIKAVNGRVTIYIDGKQMWSGQVDSLTNGYVALQSDYANLEIDDLSVKPLS